MSLVALKQGNLGVAFESSARLIRQSNDQKTVARSWFNYGLACEQYLESRSNRHALPVYDDQIYCRESLPYVYLRSWLADPAPARANKLVQVFSGDFSSSCEVTHGATQSKIHAYRTNVFGIEKVAGEGLRKLYIFHPKDQVFDASTAVGEAPHYDPVTKVHTKVQIPLGFVTAHDLGEFVLEELETSENIWFPISVGGAVCRSNEDKVTIP